MAILNNNPLVGSGGNQGYNINNSLRFRSSASAYLNRTFGTGSGTISTFSAWVKRGTLGSVAPIMFVSPNGTEDAGLQFDGNNNLSFSSWNGAGGRPLGQLITTQVFRDPSAWYHIVLAIDTTQATSSNRLKLYVNGNQVTAFGTATYPSQNATHYWNLAYEHRLGRYAAAAGTNYIDGYMAEVNFIGGQALTPSDFGETDTTTGVWKPKAYTGTYGTNGFYLKFSDIATTSGSNAGLGKDFSGNSNYWTTNNISVTSGTTYDAMTDSPTNTSATVSNYSTWNPLQKYSGLSAPTNGNLTIAGNNANWRSILSTFAVSSGKWYCEIVMTSVSTDALTGIFNINSASDLYDLTTVDNRQLARYAGGYGYQNNGNKVNNNTGTSYGSTYTTGDIVGIAFDLDNGKIWFSKNGTWQASGDPAAGTNAAYTGLSGLFAVGMSTANGTFDANFGQRPFAYTPPTGFVALNTYNLPTPTILQGNKYMDATLYSGNDASSRLITNNYGFKPDLVWIKARNDIYNHYLNDSVRGAGLTLFSNLTNSEDSGSSTSFNSFNSNGFTVSQVAGWEFNKSTKTYVGWQWQAGQGSTSSNTSGSITSTVSVNTTAGFSIVTYTGNGTNGATVGHGLGVAPKMIILKSRSDGTYNWRVYHSNLTSGYSIAINSTAAETQFATNAGYISAVSSTTFTLTQSGANTLEAVNKNGDNYVAYCWAEIAGFSRFGSYTGNGSSDGPMVYCNFSPKFVMIKRTDTIASWELFDTSRNTYNSLNLILYPNLSDAEGAYTAGEGIDSLSNGFKLRKTGTGLNNSGGTYIFMAFSSNPFKNSLAR